MINPVLQRRKRVSYIPLAHPLPHALDTNPEAETARGGRPKGVVG